MSKSATKTKSKPRKKRESEPKPPTLSKPVDTMEISDFANNQFKDFSKYACERAIPSVIDGLKTSQRKVIYGLLKSSGSDLYKVSQLAGHVAKVSDYHHGEKSLEEAITKLAQNHTGSNNLNLLFPEGQFGTRLDTSPSASRYIFTRFTECFHLLFRKEDIPVLDKQFSDGVEIEPVNYCPILPMALINGSSGIGTGFASTCALYDPNQVIDTIATMLKGKRPPELVPTYHNFKGTIEKNPKHDNKFEIFGNFIRENTTKIIVNELPIGFEQKPYKEHLNKLIDSGTIKDYDDLSSEAEGFKFILHVNREFTKRTDASIIKVLKLSKKISNNMTFWTEHHKLKVFSGTTEIIHHYVKYRLSLYEKRRLAIIDKLTEKDLLLNEKVRFIKFYIQNSKQFLTKNKAEIDNMLTTDGFNNVDTLMKMPIYSLTKDEIIKLKKGIEANLTEIETFKNTSKTKMYINDLKELKQHLKKNY